ncbi:MAG: minor capsid protein [Clostridia bacterium]|nr:minor capsid protein [Clostridia bacterium]
MNFKSADRAIKDMNRRNLRAFDRLKTLKFDELNVFRLITTVYDDAVRIAKRRYLQIAWDAYIAALILAGIDPKEAEERAEDSITEDWILDMLEDYDEVTLYRFTAEIERKKDRFVEAVIASHNKNEEVDRALRYLSQQLAQYADNAVIRATLQGYADAGVKKVRWTAEDDERVCRVCEKRDGNIYPIDKVPPAPHFRCRCILTPVFD